MIHYQRLVDLLNNLDSMSKSQYDHPYRIEVENDPSVYGGYYDGDPGDDLPTGVIFIGESVDIESKIAYTEEDIADRIKRLNSMQKSLAEIKQQIELDREFPQTED